MWLAKVAECVGDDVIDAGSRRPDQVPVEGERAGRAEAPPPPSHSPHAQPRLLDAASRHPLHADPQAFAEPKICPGFVPTAQEGSDALGIRWLACEDVKVAADQPRLLVRRLPDPQPVLPTEVEMG